LDELLYHHIERYEGAEELIGSGFDPATVQKVLRLVQEALPDEIENRFRREEFVICSLDTSFKHG
jgi:hypothetical protein